MILAEQPPTGHGMAQGRPGIGHFADYLVTLQTTWSLCRLVVSLGHFADWLHRSLTAAEYTDPCHAHGTYAGNLCKPFQSLNVHLCADHETSRWMSNEIRIFKQHSERRQTMTSLIFSQQTQKHHDCKTHAFAHRKHIVKQFKPKLREKNRKPPSCSTSTLDQIPFSAFSAPLEARRRPNAQHKFYVTNKYIYIFLANPD